MLAFCKLVIHCCVVGFFLQAIAVLDEVVWLEPNLPDAYHTLALVYGAIGSLSGSCKIVIHFCFYSYFLKVYLFEVFSCITLIIKHDK
jgi:hypothetical protein